MKRIHLFVKGFVQGVAYRHKAYMQARLRHLTGWVRNTPDGNVELVAEGKDENIAAFLSWCRKGPDGAEVKDVRVIDEQPTGEFSDFTVRY